MDFVSFNDKNLQRQRKLVGERDLPIQNSYTDQVQCLSHGRDQKFVTSLVQSPIGSESPWQRNDTTTFIIYLCVSLYQEFFLLNVQVHMKLENSTSEYCKLKIWEENWLCLRTYLKAFPVFNVLETCRVYSLTIDLRIVKFCKKIYQAVFLKNVKFVGMDQIMCKNCNKSS